MPNRNYIKGRRKEYKLVNEARAKGFIAFRSAGSHSPIDVVIIDCKTHRMPVIEFIQCKPDSMTDLQKLALEWQMHIITGPAKAYFKVI